MKATEGVLRRNQKHEIATREQHVCCGSKPLLPCPILEVRAGRVFGREII